MRDSAHIILACIIVVLSIGCHPAADKKVVQEPEMKRVFYLSSEVISTENTLITIRVEKPTLLEGDVKLALQLAQEIIENTYLMEGQQTEINESRVEVIRIIGNDVLLKIIEKSHSFKPGDEVKIFLGKKTIAIKDFEVIMGRNKEVARYVQEDVTTALVNSGQFNVVERLKLQSVLDELELTQTGLVDPKSAKQVGKLLGADVILTGTLAATGEEWNVNLRLIDTESGLVTSAFNKKAALHELKTESFREIKNISESFEKESDMIGWDLGKKSRRRIGKGGYQKLYIDKSQGANGTKQCLAMAFRLGSERFDKVKVGIHAIIRNRLKRDLSNYAGIQFYMKATEDLTIRFQVGDSQKGSAEEENWYRNVFIKQNWKEIRVPFSSLSIHQKMARAFGTNQILQLNYIERIDWVVHEGVVPRGTEGIVWLDEVAFY